MRRGFFYGAFFIALFSFLLTDSHATPINHGDFMGSTVIYTAVTEDTNTGDTLPLFGAPTVSGDSLDFDPTGFSANSSGGGPPDQTDGQLKFGIVAKQGHFIEKLHFSEAGDTSLARGLGTTDDAQTTVAAHIFVDILEVNGSPINSINVGPISMAFSPSNGDYLLSTDGNGSATYGTAWTGSAWIDLAPHLAANNIVGKATKVSVNLDNTLTASSATNSSAFIAKKDADGLTITTNVPEPTAVGLVLAGLLMTIAGRSRRLG